MRYNERSAAEKKASKNGGGDTSRKVLKVMSIFTGVESLGILCSMVKNKLIALWIGAAGLGFMNIFNSTIEAATYLTGLGLRQSAVRDISLASRQGEGTLRRVIARVRTWSVVAGLLGALALTALAWPLAQIIFRNGLLWWNFAVLGGAMLLNALYCGETAVFQGTENFRRMARTGVMAAFSGLLLSIPLFRLLGTSSISLSILVYSICALVCAIINRDRKHDASRPSAEMMREENQFVKFGAWIAVTAFINSVCQLAFASWLSVEASVAEVGFYSAGITLVVRYTSLFFSSVGLEYYPRVSACIANTRRTSIFMNHEVALLLLLFTPMTLLFLIFKDWIILLLYKVEFLVILPFVSWGILLVILRAVSNTMAFTIMAKGEGKIYMLTDSFDALLGLALSIWLYKAMGLTGIGIALVAWHTTYMLVVALICKLRYGLSLNRRAGLTVVSSLLAAGLALWATLTLPKIAYIPTLSIVALIYIYLFITFLRHRQTLTQNLHFK